jgi:hypothetical protein
VKIALYTALLSGAKGPLLLFDSEPEKFALSSMQPYDVGSHGKGCLDDYCQASMLELGGLCATVVPVLTAFSQGESSARVLKPRLFTAWV